MRDYSNDKKILKSESAISLIALIITIIVIIIISGIVIFYSNNVIENSLKADFLTELSNVQYKVTVKRTENTQIEGNQIDNGFKKIRIINEPNTFVNVDDTDEVYGYVADLDLIGITEANFGKEYKTIQYETGEVIFGETDIYVFDKTGTVYYAKGFRIENEVIYKLSGEVEFHEPVIKSVSYLLHSSKHKAMISIEAVSKTGTSVNVTVGGEEAGYQQANRFYIEKTKNGTYEVVVTDEFGNFTKQNIEISGIIGENETVTVTEPVILSLTAGEQKKRKIEMTATAEDTDDGIIAYAFVLGNGMPASEWIEISNTKTQITKKGIAEQTGDYYFWVKNAENISSSRSISIFIDQNIYNIEYNLCGGRWSDNGTRDFEKANDETVHLTNEVPIREGYTFLGWSTSMNNKTISYHPNDSYSDESDLYLYAVWSANTNTPYIVEHYKEDANEHFQLTDTDHLTGTTDTTATATPKEYQYYEINNYYPDLVKEGLINGNGSLVLKLYYSRTSFNLNLTGDNGTEIGSGNHKHGTTVNIKATPNEGYDFSNWKVKNGAVTSFENNKAETSFVMPTSNVTMEAEYSLIQYNISYDLNGGSVLSNPSKYTIEDTFTLNQPTKDGYRFSGWTGTGISGKLKNVSVSHSTGDRNYTANYDELFQLEITNQLPTYDPVGIKIKAIENVRIQYRLNDTSSWQECGTLSLNDQYYTTTIYAERNGIINVRALKSNNEVEIVKDIEITNIIPGTVANAPILGANMTPIYWEGNTEKSSNSYSSTMYDYTASSGDSKWANAKTEDGSYWVWLPRFAYKVVYYENSARTTISSEATNYERIFILFTKGNSSQKYEDTLTHEEKDIPNDFTIPNAFTYQSSQLNGIWIAKYDMSMEKMDGENLVSINSSLGGGNILTKNAGNMEDVSVVSKPNKTSWRGITQANAINNSRKMFETKQSSLISNAEWDAIVLLTQSDYGVDNTHVSSSSTYTTGSGGSTTGNKSGIYDYASATWEYVQGNKSSQEYAIAQYVEAMLNIINAPVSNVRGMSVSSQSASKNIAINGDADARIGYRVVLHINS